MALSLGCSSGASAPAARALSGASQPAKSKGASAAGSAEGVAGSAAAGASGQGNAASQSGATPPAMSNAGRAAPQTLPPAGGFASMQDPPDAKVTFDWQETQPGQGKCQPGTYSGTFTCSYLPMGDTDPNDAIEVTGPVAFTLTQSQNGEFLEISDGHVDGVAALVFGFTAKLSGKLDCSSNMLDAMAVDGMYGFGDPNALPAGTFAGGLTGMLDRSTSSLTGQWMLTATDGYSGECDGPWMATYTP